MGMFLIKFKFLNFFINLFIQRNFKLYWFLYLQVLRKYSTLFSNCIHFQHLNNGMKKYCGFSKTLKNSIYWKIITEILFRQKINNCPMLIPPKKTFVIFRKPLGGRLVLFLLKEGKQWCGHPMLILE